MPNTKKKAYIKPLVKAQYPNPQYSIPITDIKFLAPLKKYPTKINPTIQEAVISAS